MYCVSVRTDNIKRKDFNEAKFLSAVLFKVKYL